MSFQVKEQLAIYNAKGRKTHVILSVRQFRQLLERLEDAEDIRAIKAVQHERRIPWSEVKKSLHKKA